MTTYGPFAETTPRGQTGWIDERRRPISEHVRAVLGKLDGTSRFTYTVWRGSNPESIVVTHGDDAETFIQAAGSAEAMTVEVRLRGEDGDHHLYTIGRKQTAGAGTDETVLVPIGPDRSVRVLLREIFTADEAAEIFAAFTRTDTVPEVYARRELDLSVAQSEPR